MNQWRGDAVPATDTWVLTVTGPATGGGSIDIPIGEKVIRVTFINTETAAVVAARINDALANSTIPEFYELAWNVNANVVTGVMKSAGRPTEIGALTVTAAVGIAVALTNPVAATGPNWANNPANWTRGVLPGDGAPEQVVIDGGPAILYGLTGMYAGPCTSTHFKASFTAGVGLSRRNQDGPTAYFEFRNRALDLSDGGVIHVGEGPGQGVSRFVGTLADGQTAYVYTSATGEEDGFPAVDFGSGAGDDPLLLGVFGGSAGWGVTQTAGGAIARATAPGGELMLNGEADAVEVRGGTVTSRSVVNTSILIQSGLYVQDDGSIDGPIVADGGICRLNHEQATPITVTFRGSTAGDPPVLDLSGNDKVARDLSDTSSFTGGARLLDPFYTAVLDSVTFDRQSFAASDIGDHFQITRTAG